jgi:hypothetical protein
MSELVEFNMRLTEQQRHLLLESVQQVLGGNVTTKLFGSRVDDQAKGGDIDLYVSSCKPIAQPAYCIAMMQTKMMRVLDGRRVDILLDAPNLKKQAIHRIAEQQGVLL